MALKQRVVSFWKKLRGYPTKYTIPGAVIVLLAAIYGVIFFVDTPVAFSYAGKTCVNQLTLLPGLHKISSGTDYKLEPTQLVRVGNIVLASRGVCVTPAEPPVEGTTKMSIAPFGGAIMRKTFAVTVGPTPVAEVAILNQPVPVSRPLTLPLSGTDRVFTYYMKAGEAQVECIPEDKATSCDVRKLGLLQGTPYTVELIRQFGDTKVGTVVKKDITTLSAANVTDSSVKAGEVVYSKPKTFDFTFDKQVVKATPTLYRIEGEARTLVATTLSLGDKTMQVVASEDLPRSVDYELVIDALEAADGSGLEAPYKLAFKTSGGPKVAGVNIGRTGVAMGTTAVITFDQPLSDKQDVGAFVTTVGGAALSGKKGNQLFVSLAGVPKCSDFSIKITNDLQSNYDIAGNSGWSFTGRTICHAVGTIGYSSRGRAINAYYFGSGPATVLYTGAIHGSEASTRYLMDAWINDLEANARNIPAGKSVVVVPQINPDGIASGSRVNARNVDLNRNFATNDWRTDVTTVNNQPFPGGGGPSPMSEPETQAIASLVQRLHPVLVLSYHSVGSVVAANQAGASSAHASTYSQLSGYGNITGQTGGTFEYAVSGTADDWYAEKLGVGSILIELGSSSYHQFSRNQKAMWAMLNNT